MLNRLLYFAAALIFASSILVVAPAEASYVYWTNGSSGDWRNPMNWSCYPYTPRSTDDAEIDRAGTLTIEHASGGDVLRSLSCYEILNLSGGSLSVSGASFVSGGLDLTGGTLTGLGTFAISNTGYWTAGTMSSLGGLTNNGTWEISGPGLKYMPGNLTNAKIINHKGNVDISYGSLYNSSTGTYDIQTDTGFTNPSGGGEVTNGGIFRKTMSSGTSTIAAAFNNSKTLSVLTGTLQLSGGGTSMNGTFDMPSNTSYINFTNGTHTMNGACKLTGYGRATLSAGGITMGPGSTLTNELRSTFKFTYGTVSGPTGFFVNDGTAEWSGGSMVGVNDFRNNNTMTLTGSSFRYLQNGTLSNNATATHSGSGSVVFSQSSRLFNLSGATYDLQSNAHFLSWDGTGTIFNNGTLRKSYSYGTSYVDPFLNNGWLVDVQSGSMILRGGGSFTNAGASINHLATLSFDTGAFSFSGENEIWGGGIAALTGGTLTLSEGATAKFGLEQGASLIGSIVTGHGNLRNTWTMNWSGGTVTGTTHFLNDGTLNIRDGSTKLLSNALLFNTSSIIQTAVNGPTLASGAELTNQSTGTYDFQSDGGISGSGTVKNGGVFSKTWSTGTSTIEPFFDCTAGSMLIDTGTIKLMGGGTFWDGGAAINYPGNLTLGGGIFTANGQPQFIGDGSATLSGGTLNLAYGTQTRFALDYGLNLAGTAVKGPGTLISGIAGDWTYSALSSSAALDNQGTLTLSGTAVKSLDASRIINSGTITHNGTGALQFGSASSFDNRGTYEFRADAGITAVGAGNSITNTSVFRKDWSTGISTIQPAFNNQGLIEAKAGTLRFTGGGSWYGGAATTSSQAKLDLASGTYNLTGEFFATGSGSISLGGTLALSPGARAHFSADQGFHLAGGAIAGNGSAFVGVVGDWTTGTIAEDASLIDEGTFALLGDTAKYLKRGHLVAQGRINHAGRGILDVDEGSDVRITSTGRYDLQGDGVLSGPGKIINGGLLIKSGGEESVIEPSMDNGVKVQVDSGVLVFRGPVVQLVERTLTGGQWVVNDRCVLDMGGEQPIWTNAGDVTLIGDSQFPQFDSMVTNSGTLRLLEGRGFRAQDVFTNSGTFELDGGEFRSGKNTNTGQWTAWGLISGGLTNRGTLTPEAASEALRITGNCSQTSTGTLEIVIGGRSDSQFSRLIVGGTATLAGKLKITLSNGFVPSRGDSFQILTGKSRTGVFSQIDGAQLGNGLYVNAIYTSTAVLLVVGDPMPTPTEIGSVAAARQQALDSWLSLPGVVSAVFADCFYVQDANRTGGIRVISLQTSPAVGQKVHVAGQLYADSACLTLTYAEFFTYPDALQPPKPLFVTGRNQGGAALGLQGGVNGAAGLSNVGLLVRVTGHISYNDRGSIIYLDDGSGVWDGNRMGAFRQPVPGIRVLLPTGVTIPTSATRASVTGISYRLLVGGLWQREVMVRAGSDVVAQ